MRYGIELPDYAEPVMAAAWMAATIAQKHAGASPDSPMCAAIFNSLLPFILEEERQMQEEQKATGTEE